MISVQNTTLVTFGWNLIIFYEENDFWFSLWCPPACFGVSWWRMEPKPARNLHGYIFHVIKLASIKRCSLIRLCVRSQTGRVRKICPAFNLLCPLLPTKGRHSTLRLFDTFQSPYLTCLYRCSIQTCHGECMCNMGAFWWEYISWFLKRTNSLLIWS